MPNNLIIRDGRGATRDVVMIIDPWTQRWAVTRPRVPLLLPLADGTRTIDEIADAAGQDRRLGLFTDPELVRGLMEQLRSSGLAYSTARHHRASGNSVYSASDILGLHLEITNACNLACRHCYVSSGSKLPNELTTDEIRRVIDQLTPFSAQRLCISGGEPAVRRDCMDLVEYAVVECGLSVDLYSNAYKFPRKLAERMVSLNEIGPGSVDLQVSIEGARAETNDAVRGAGVFDRITQSMELFRELGLNRRLTLFACVTSANVGEVEQMIRLAEDWDARRIVFSQWQRQGNASDTPWRTIAPSRAQWCAAGEAVLARDNPRLEILGNFFGDLNNSDSGHFSLDAGLFPKHLYAYNAYPRISPDGLIFADQFWTDPEWSLGNVREMTLSRAFRTDKFYHQIDAFRQRWRKIPECASCQWLTLCESGSPGHTHAEYGDLNHKDLFCESRQYWFERYADYQMAASVS